jgi:uncharacterized protein (TIGR03067 family)
LFADPSCPESKAMNKTLPARPNLDHLRRQAKALLAALEHHDKEAISTILKHLPAAKSMTAAEVTKTDFRLADAQSAIARENGFAGWPHLARHVEQLRSLEGTWSFSRLEIEDAVLLAPALSSSRILIDGDRFRTESPEATYEGIFNINVETEPHEIDIEFVEGPEAGNSNFGIYRLENERLEICLDLNGKPRPKCFASRAGSGHAYEILQRTSHARPENVKGGNPISDEPPVLTADASEFAFVDSPLAKRLQGKWSAVKIVRDGQELPAMMLRTGLRVATKNEIKISFGGQTMIHALVRFNESTEPMEVDYLNIGTADKGAVQFGLLKWINDEPCFCMASPGQPRPQDFTCPTGSGRTISQWRLKK